MGALVLSSATLASLFLLIVTGWVVAALVVIVLVMGRRIGDENRACGSEGGSRSGRSGRMTRGRRGVPDRSWRSSIERSRRRSVNRGRRSTIVAVGRGGVGRAGGRNRRLGRMTMRIGGSTIRVSGRRSILGKALRNWVWVVPLNLC